MVLLFFNAVNSLGGFLKYCQKPLYITLFCYNYCVYLYIDGVGNVSSRTDCTDDLRAGAAESCEETNNGEEFSKDIRS